MAVVAAAVAAAVLHEIFCRRHCNDEVAVVLCGANVPVFNPVNANVVARVGVFHCFCNGIILLASRRLLEEGSTSKKNGCWPRVKQEEFTCVETHVGGAATNDNDDTIAALLVVAVRCRHSEEPVVGTPIIVE